MCDAKCMNVSKRSAHLVGVEFDEEIWNVLLLLVVVLHHSVDGLGDVVHYHIKIKLILLRVRGCLPWCPSCRRHGAF